MSRYDIRIRRAAFQEKRTSRFRNFDQLARRYRRERLKQLMLRVFYLIVLIGISLAAFFLFR